MNDLSTLSRRLSAFLPILTAMLLLVPACGQAEDATADATTTGPAVSTVDVMHGGPDGGAAPKGAEPKPFVDPGPPPETVIVTVNGEAITQGDIDAELRANQFGGMRVEAAHMARVRQQHGAQAERRLVDQKLLESAIRAAKITVTPEELAARWAEIKKQAIPPGVTREAFLKQRNLKLEEVNVKLIQNMKIAKLFKQSAEPAKTTDEAAQVFYKANILKFQTPAKVRARHILIKVPQGAADAEKDKAREKLAGIRDEIVKAGGKNFAAMAMQHSGCPSKNDGGDLKFFGRGQMVPEFDQLAFTMEKGTVSEPFATQFGFHILEVTDKQEAGTRTFEQEKANIKTRLDQEAAQTAQVTYVESLRTAAKIERPAQKAAAGK